MELKLLPTSRGFFRADFLDANNCPCSIQESSVATEALIWLGENDNRMHLTVDHAKALIPLLQTFVAIGELKERDE